MCGENSAYSISLFYRLGVTFYQWYIIGQPGDNILGRLRENYCHFFRPHRLGFPLFFLLYSFSLAYKLCFFSADLGQTWKINEYWRRTATPSLLWPTHSYRWVIRHFDDLGPVWVTGSCKVSTRPIESGFLVAGLSQFFEFFLKICCKISVRPCQFRIAWKPRTNICSSQIMPSLFNGKPQFPWHFRENVISFLCSYELWVYLKPIGLMSGWLVLMALILYH